MHGPTVPNSTIVHGVTPPKLISMRDVLNIDKYLHMKSTMNIMHGIKK